MVLILVHFFLFFLILLPVFVKLLGILGLCFVAILSLFWMVGTQLALGTEGVFAPEF